MAAGHYSLVGAVVEADIRTAVERTELPTEVATGLLRSSCG